MFFQLQKIGTLVWKLLSFLRYREYQQGQTGNRQNMSMCSHRDITRFHTKFPQNTCSKTCRGMTRTTITCLSFKSSLQSVEIVATPLETVEFPYDWIRTKSTKCGSEMYRTRSAVNIKAPVAICKSVSQIASVPFKLGLNCFPFSGGVVDVNPQLGIIAS